METKILEFKKKIYNVKKEYTKKKKESGIFQILKDYEKCLH